MQNHSLSQNSFATITLVYNLQYGSLVASLDVVLPRTVAKDLKAKAIKFN